MSDQNYIPFGPRMSVKNTKEVGEVIEHNYDAVEHCDLIEVKLRFKDGREQTFHPRDLDDVAE